MMDGPGGARDPRFNLGYNMGLLGEAQADMYGAPRALGAARGLKRPGSEPCYEERPPHPLQLEHCAMPDVPDDGYASLQPKKSPPSNGKKTKGRVKIKMEYIDNKLRRYTTFSKRKTGIMKKAYELSTLTGTQVMLLVASETGHVYTFATRKLQPMITSDSGKRLIQTCLNSPDPPTGAPLGDQRMSATGFEETELTYNIADEDIKKLGGIQIDEQMSSAESGDESGSEPESPADRLKRSPAPARRMESPELGNRSAAGSSSSYEAEHKSGPTMRSMNSAAAASGLNAAILCRPNMLGGVGLEGLAPNLTLGNLAMGYPHGVIIGLANQSADGSSQSQPQFITIPLSMAMAAAAAAGGGSESPSDLQDLSTGPRK